MSVVFWSIYYMICCLFILASFIHVLLASAWLHWPGWMGSEGEGEACGLGYLASPGP